MGLFHDDPASVFNSHWAFSPPWEVKFYLISLETFVEGRVSRSTTAVDSLCLGSWWIADSPLGIDRLFLSSFLFPTTMILHSWSLQHLLEKHTANVIFFEHKDKGGASSHLPNNGLCSLPSLDYPGEFSPVLWLSLSISHPGGGRWRACLWLGFFYVWGSWEF